MFKLRLLVLPPNYRHDRPICDECTDLYRDTYAKLRANCLAAMTLSTLIDDLGPTYFSRTRRPTTTESLFTSDVDLSIGLDSREWD